MLNSITTIEKTTLELYTHFQAIKEKGLYMLSSIITIEKTILGLYIYFQAIKKKGLLEK